MIINKLKENAHLSETEKEICKYIEQNPQKIFSLTLKELGKDSHTNASSFIRLTHKLGFKGWNDFKVQYLKEIAPIHGNQLSHRDINIPFSNNNNFLEISNIVTEIKKTALNDVLSQIDFKILRKCIDLIDRSHKITIFAHNINLVLSKEFEFKMRRLGKEVSISELDNEQIYDALNLTNQDCAILISYSGSGFNEIVDCLTQNHVPFIGITSDTTNLINLSSNFVLYMSTREKLYSKVDNYTTNTSVIQLLDIMYSCYFARHFNTNLAKLISKGKIANNRQNDSSIISENH